MIRTDPYSSPVYLNEFRHTHFLWSPTHTITSPQSSSESRRNGRTAALKLQYGMLLNGLEFLS
jgi:hypothetical protein